METFVRSHWFWSGRCVHWGHNHKPNPGPKSSRSGRKHGRDRVKCARYRAEGRRERNKERKRRQQGRLT